MDKKIHSVMMLALLLVGMLTLAFNIKGARADWTWTETIYIRADGSIEPDTTPISSVDNITYTLTDNIVDAAPSSHDIAVIIERNNIVLNGAGYTLQGTQAYDSTGMSFEGRSNVTIKNIDIRDFYWGIYLYGSSNNTVSGNNITNNGGDGIRLSNSSSNSVSANNITANKYDGIYLYGSSNNTVSGNNITNNGGDGIVLGYSSNNGVSGNNVTNNRDGISLNYYSSNNSVSGNNVVANNWDGIMLYYYSSNNSVSGNNVVANYLYGTYLRYSSNNGVSGNNIAGNRYGTYLLDNSSNNSISGNNITANKYDGVKLDSSSSNSIGGNSITNNGGDGIELSDSSNNTIARNNIANNSQYGIQLRQASNNGIYHNNLITNAEQVNDWSWTHPETEPSVNTWDDGYPSGGNYWSDYEERYPDAEELDGSGIWDTPYVIDENNQDNHPLMEPWTPTPPIPTTIDELKTEIEKLGSEGEIDNQGIVTSLIAKLNVAQKLVDDGKIDQAKNILNAFINEVQAQSGKHITPEAAELLIESAEHILSHLQN